MNKEYLNILSPSTQHLIDLVAKTPRDKLNAAKELSKITVNSVGYYCGLSYYELLVKVIKYKKHIDGFDNIVLGLVDMSVTEIEANRLYVGKLTTEEIKAAVK